MYILVYLECFDDLSKIVRIHLIFKEINFKIISFDIADEQKQVYKWQIGVKLY